MLHRRERLVWKIVLLFAILNALAAVTLGCGANQRPALEPDAVQPYNRLEAVRLVNDVGDVAIAANESDKLSKELTAHILTIGWQVRDFIEANPLTTYTRVILAIREGLDAVPPDIRAQIQSYFDVALTALQKLSEAP